jgi:uncharacterized metal-binding protein
MATGVRHKTASKRGAIVLFTAVAITTGEPGLGALAGWGCLFGIVCSPDLDIPEVTISERVMVDLFGKAGWLWFYYWLPYGLLFRHRHMLSHAPVLGTAVRLIWLLWIPFLLGVWNGIRFDQLPVEVLIAFVGGLAFSDLLHWAMDFLF